MGRKIIASDFDGTLCQGGRVEQADIEAIQRFREAGNLFGLVTGRSPDNFYSFKKENRFGFDFFLALNGACALDTDGNILYQHIIDGNQPVPKMGNKPLKRAICEVLFEQTGSCVITSIDRRSEFIVDKPEGDEHCAPHSEIDLFEKILSINSYTADYDRTEGIINDHIKPIFDGILNPLRNGGCIDIPGWGMNKGIAVEKYASIMGIEAKDIWTAGDNLNDIDMLERFNGCAMLNGAQEAKSVAKHVAFRIRNVVDMAMADE